MSRLWKVGPLPIALWLMLAAPACAADPMAVAVVDVNSIGGRCDDARPLADVGPTTPWCTPERAIAAMRSGGVVVLRRASYPRLTAGASTGRVGPITLHPFPGEEGAVEFEGVTLEGADRLVFEGIRFVGSFVMEENTRDVTVRGGEHQSLILIGAGSSNILIQGNRISEPRGYGVNFAAGPTTPMIRNVTIRANTFDGIGADAIQAKRFKNLLIEHNEVLNVIPRDAASHPDVLQTVHGGENLIVRNNYFHDSAGGIILKDGMVFGATFENNLMIRLTKSSPFTIHAKDLRLVNNTIWDSPVTSVVRSDVRGAVILNNIFQVFAVENPASVAVQDHNIFRKDTSPSPTRGAHDIIGSPTFVSRVDSDYRLRPGSLGIDAGTSAGAPTTDRLGQRRKDDPHTPNRGGGRVRYVDIGAHELPDTAPRATMPAPRVRVRRRITLTERSRRVPLTVRCAEDCSMIARLEVDPPGAAPAVTIKSLSRRLAGGRARTLAFSLSKARVRRMHGARPARITVIVKNDGERRKVSRRLTLRVLRSRA